MPLLSRFIVLLSRAFQFLDTGTEVASILYLVSHEGPSPTIADE
jgi:hypothetical protein